MSDTRIQPPELTDPKAQAVTTLVLKSRESAAALREGRAVAGAGLRLRAGSGAGAEEIGAREGKLRIQGVEGRGGSSPPEGRGKLTLPVTPPQPRPEQRLPEVTPPLRTPALEVEGNPCTGADAARPAPEKVNPATAGSASTGQTGRTSTKSLVLRKKQGPAFEGGRDVVLERERDPVCCNCQVSFSVDDDLEPLSRIVCPRCQTRQVVPARIGHFLLERELGRGGMGVTYRAFDRSLLRNVAVKIISEKRAGDREHIESIVREARRAATLSHPHIVPVHSIGSVEGRPYFVMELLSDSQFSRRVAKGAQLDEVFVLETGLAVARALAEAAEHGILHLDVKPANILHDRFGAAKLIDFGLACEISDDRSHGWGTCLYMAPERLRRRGQDIRSDQYSLGITMWQALAGRRPFEAEDNEALSAKILKEAPPVLNQVRDGILDWTAGLVHKMISHDAADRYQDYDELIWAFEYVLGALRGATAGQPSSADTP